MSTLVKVILSLPSGVWLTDDGTTNGPTVGNGSNGGQLGQIFLHNGVNVGVSDTAVRAFINNSALGQSLFAQGLISTRAS